ncbi:MAG: rRNA maturation RNase YbeY [Armatimonadetes bacterium]|nr:rRNA maturation RNase YbeY [Armatimonadota bacterium]
MQILIRNSQKIPVKLRRVRSIAQRLLRAENCPDNMELSILLADDARIVELNKEYRDIDGPTDVLSFSQLEGEDEAIPGVEEDLLGDVVISVETARRQAENQGHSLDREIDILLVHGILHLLGYDHAEPEDERVMFARQEEILGNAE